MWILIIFFLASNSHDGKAVATAEFMSKSLCEKAQSQIGQLHQVGVQTVCVYGGE